MKTAALFLISIYAVAAPTAKINSVDQTQAVLAIRGYSGDCTIKVSETPPGTYTPLHPDVNGSEYAGSSTAMGRADTITWSDGTLLVTIGHQDHDRALAAATAYYWQISGGSCGGTVSGSFSTPTLGNGSGQQWPAPFDSTQPWNYGYPQVNLLTPTWVVDPITGVKLRPLNSAGDRSWRTGSNGLGTGPTAGFTAFQDWAGGTGWSNPGNALNNSTSTASTTNTNPIDLYGIYNRFTFSAADGAFLGISFDDLGAVIFGSATNQTGTNNQISACIFTSPVAGCLGTPVTISLTATSGAPAKVSASSDPDGAWPNNFPTAFFSGWGLTAPLGPDHVNTAGTLTGCTAAVCTITTPTSANFFPSTMVAGQKIFITGSSPTCTNNLCTLASYQNQGQITLSENLTAGAVAYNVYMWGLRIAKVTATGTAVIGAAFKHAGSLGVGQADANGYVCNPHGFTSGDGHFGYLCTTPSFTNSGGYSTMYFVSGDGTVRNLWNNNVWPSATCFASSNVNDLPPFVTSGGVFTGQALPDVTNPKTFYVFSFAGASGKSLFKIVYSGDTTENLASGYLYSQNGAGPPISAAPCGHWAATNLLPASTALDIPSQIVANWSGTFNTSIYPNTGSSWLFTGTGGIFGGYALFLNSYGGGQNSPMWIAIVDLSTGLITNLINTLDGTGTSSYFGGMRWCGLHTTYNNFLLPLATITCDAAVAGNTSQLLAGPFEVAPAAVLQADGVTWDTNTCLDWPIGSGSGCAHRGSVPVKTDCPGGNPYVFMGATSPNCVTFKFPTGGACNVAPSTAERAAFTACPWNASYTKPVDLQAGDVFVDWDTNACLAQHTIFVFLCEQFRIISVTSGGGFLTVVTQRNAMYDGCSFNPTPFPGYPNSNLGNLAASGLQHAATWTAVMAPNKLSGCYADSYVFSKSTNGIIGESSLISGGHPEIIPGSVPGGSLASIIVGTNARTDRALNNTIPTGLFAYPTTSFNLPGPTFQGHNGGLGSIVQSYVESVGANPWMSDANALNGPSGTGPELFFNSIGSVTMTPVAGNVYTITPISNGLTMSKVNYKKFPLVGWAGRYLLHDISGVGSNIDTSPWGICHVYNAGECHALSVADTIYVNVPGAYRSGMCLTGQSFELSPCVVFGSPGGGGVRQQRITGPDPTGQGSRLLSYLLTAPGEMYPYTHMISSADNSFGIASAHHTQGWTVMPWVLKLPPWQEDSSDRTTFGGITVHLPAGSAFAEIQFGYSRFIGANAAPTVFYCTSRREACNTRSDTSSIPYNFNSETRSNQACASGCTINIPVMAPNLVYYRIRRSSDGATWVNQDTIPIAVF